MSRTFSVGEIFDVALQLERNGYTFYRKAAEYAQDESLRQMLLDLAQMETDHELAFIEMKAKYVGPEMETDWFKPDGVTPRYLQALARKHVFNTADDASLALSEQSDMRDILSFAIDREEASVLFYVGIKELVAGKTGRGKIDAIIQEEMEHITLLDRKLQALKP